MFFLKEKCEIISAHSFRATKAINTSDKYGLEITAKKFSNKKIEATKNFYVRENDLDLKVDEDKKIM